MGRVIENDIEKHFVSSCSRRGLLQMKFVAPANAGVPDRLVMSSRWPGQVLFVELKRPGEQLRPRQVANHARIIRHGGRVVTVSTTEQVDRVLDLFEAGGTSG